MAPLTLDKVYVEASVGTINVATETYKSIGNYQCATFVQLGDEDSV